MENFVNLDKLFKMNRQDLIENVIHKIGQLPDKKLIEISDFADFLLSKIDSNIIQEGIQNLVSESKTFEFLKEEPELYSVKDVREIYNDKR